MLVANLQPSFTVLHKLTLIGGASPAIGLGWHAPSSNENLGILAVQKRNGDLRVWRVRKNSNVRGSAEVIRTLTEGDDFAGQLHWMAWSQEGRIIQHYNGYVWQRYYYQQA